MASRPPCTLGCRVLTVPSIISGKPVSSETSLTLSPAAAIAFAVPPVETSSTPWPTSARANSASPVLSETDNRARVTWRGCSVIGYVLQARSCPARLNRINDPFFFEHDLFGNPVSTFPDHALRPPGSTVLASTKPAVPARDGVRAILQGQFRLAAGVAPGAGCRSRGRRAGKAPADRGC